MKSKFLIRVHPCSSVAHCLFSGACFCPAADLYQRREVIVEAGARAFICGYQPWGVSPHPAGHYAGEVRFGVRAAIGLIGFTAAAAQIVFMRELLAVSGGNEQWLSNSRRDTASRCLIRWKWNWRSAWRGSFLARKKFALGRTVQMRPQAPCAPRAR